MSHAEQWCPPGFSSDTAAAAMNYTGRACFRSYFQTYDGPLVVVLQIEIGQLDSTIAVSNVPLGNMSYWFEGNSIVITMNLTTGMLNQPLGIFVNKTSPPIAPPSQLDNKVGGPTPPNLACHKTHGKLTMAIT